MSPTWTRALVTGASRGIGEALARRLAAEGTALVLSARDLDRLDALADRLTTDHGIEVEVITADLADPDERQRVEDRLAERDRPVDLLVNNAGFGDAGPFRHTDVARQEAEIDVNVVAVVRLTHAALGPMLDRGSGAILNVSSVVSRLPSPTNAVYAASKAFVTSFSEALHEDLRDAPVTVTAVEPGFTITDFQANAGVTHSAGVPEWVWMTAEQVAEAGLDGARAGRAVVVPGLTFKAITTGLEVMPKGAVRRLIGAAARRVAAAAQS